MDNLIYALLFVVAVAVSSVLGTVCGNWTKRWLERRQARQFVSCDADALLFAKVYATTFQREVITKGEDVSDADRAALHTAWGAVLNARRARGEADRCTSRSSSGKACVLMVGHQLVRQGRPHEQLRLQEGPRRRSLGVAVTDDETGWLCDACGGTENETDTCTGCHLELCEECCIKHEYPACAGDD